MNRKIVAGFFVFSVLCVIPVVLWYAVAFAPYVDRLKSFSKEGIIDSGKNLEILHRYALQDESRDRIRSYAIKMAVLSLRFEQSSKTHKWWVLDYYLWYLSSYIVLDEKEIFGVWVSCSLYGCGKGLGTAAELNFNRHIFELDNKELASLVVLVRSPSVYPIGSKRSEDQVREILKQ